MFGLNLREETWMKLDIKVHFICPTWVSKTIIDSSLLLYYNRRIGVVPVHVCSLAVKIKNMVHLQMVVHVVAPLAADETETGADI